MGSSFVEVDEKGFWMNDSLLCLWLRLLALHVQSDLDQSAPEMVARNGWLLQSESHAPGVVVADLDSVARDQKAKQKVVSAIRRLLSKLESHVGPLEPTTINLLGVSSIIWSHPVETSRLIEIGNAFLDLLAGKITTGADSTEFMPGSRP
ncbi:hypothetical protein NKH61_29125 [Mesorhizobium sp. M1005]|uniref:hypothetical protein n=1 Tax=unclassified Mesorhizobium TaxID=325217 RepID=UPI00333DF917